MGFIKYQHIERFGTDEVDGIEFGNCFIFPKIDGTNSSVWTEFYPMNEMNVLKAGSRNRQLSVDNDNAGFYNHVLQNNKIEAYLQAHPEHRLFGEFLVPHTLKTYRQDAWRRFYVFDVCIDKGEDELEYIPYDIYQSMLEEFELDYIPAIAKIKNPTYDSLIRVLNQNNFLIEDGKGIGEGIVIKNYDFYNKYKRQTWAKIVTSEFKENHYKTMGCPEINTQAMVEEKIVEEFCTQAFIEKEFDKIRVEHDGWQSKYIAELLDRVFSELIKEESWNFVKKHKMPKIDYRTLNSLVIQKIKEVKREIFN